MKTNFDNNWIRLPANEMASSLVDMRRHLHRHPELAFQEVETAAYVAAKLKEWGYEVQTGIAGTGVVGVLHGQKERADYPWRVVALRADMDALPVQEQNSCDYASENEGVMHACGHDVHMAVALGVAKLFATRQQDFRGTLKMIFQPAEEGPGGAQGMIEAGVLQNPKVEYVLGGHVWPGVPVGSIAVQPGPMMAAADKWELTIQGRGGHGAEPHLCIDPIAIGAQVVTALQQVVSRINNPLEPAVLSVGMFQGGTRDNIIADTVYLAGTLRTFSPENRVRLKAAIGGVIGGICASFDATYQLQFSTGYPTTLNDERMTAALVASAEYILGADRVQTKMNPGMPAEDFSYFAQQIPAVYMRLGITDETHGVYPLHHNCFDVHEDAMVVGVQVYARAIVDLFQHGTDLASRIEEDYEVRR